MLETKGTEWAKETYGGGWPSCSTPLVSVNIFGRSMSVADGTQRLWRRVDRVFKAKCPAYYEDISSERDTGSYNCRPIAGTTRPSFHSFGLAVDLDWTENARDGDRKSEMRDRGMPAIKELRNEVVWGGDWSSPDDMHFECAHSEKVYKARYFKNGRRKPWFIAMERSKA